MNHLIAKIKLQGATSLAKKYKKINSDQVIFELPNKLDSSIEYSIDYNLDEDSWFKIENFKQKDYCIDLLKCTFNSVEYSQLNKNDKIDFICSYQNKNEYYFQRITKSKILKKSFITLGEDFKYIEDSKMIIINDKPDAIYLMDKDTLYFQKLSIISSIFKGIDRLFREATTSETKDFLNIEFIKLENNFDVDKVDKMNRCRITKANEILGNLDKDQKSSIKDYIIKYFPKLEDGGDLKIASNGDLKKLLYGIDQRYYTTELSNEERCANSIVKINEWK